MYSLHQKYGITSWSHVFEETDKLEYITNGRNKTVNVCKLKSYEFLKREDIEQPQDTFFSP